MRGAHLLALQKCLARGGSGAESCLQIKIKRREIPNGSLERG